MRSSIVNCLDEAFDGDALACLGCIKQFTNLYNLIIRECSVVPMKQLF
jgi:hypothetical protein